MDGPIGIATRRAGGEVKVRGRPTLRRRATPQAGGGDKASSPAGQGRKVTSRKGLTVQALKAASDARIEALMDMEKTGGDDTEAKMEVEIEAGAGAGAEGVEAQHHVGAPAVYRGEGSDSPENAKEGGWNLTAFDAALIKMASDGLVSESGESSHGGGRAGSGGESSGVDPDGESEEMYAGIDVDLGTAFGRILDDDDVYGDTSAYTDTFLAVPGLGGPMGPEGMAGETMVPGAGAEEGELDAAREYEFAFRRSAEHVYMPELSQEDIRSVGGWDMSEFEGMPGLGPSSSGGLFIDVSAVDRTRPSVSGPHTSRGVPESLKSLHVDAKKLKGSRSLGASPRSPGVAKPPRSPRSLADRLARNPGVGGRPSGTGPPPQPVAPDVLEQLTTKQLQKQFYSQYHRVTTANNRGWLVRKLSEGWSPGMQCAINWAEVTPSGTLRQRKDGPGRVRKEKKDKAAAGGTLPAEGQWDAGPSPSQGTPKKGSGVAREASAPTAAAPMPVPPPDADAAPFRLAVDPHGVAVDASGQPLSAAALLEAAGPGSGGDVVVHAELGAPGAKVVGRRLEVFHLPQLVWKRGTLEGVNSRRGTGRVRYDDDKHEEVNFQRAICRWLPLGIKETFSKASQKRAIARAALAVAG